VACKRPLREEETARARAKAGPGSTLCCYASEQVEICEGRPLRASANGAPIVAKVSGPPSAVWRKIAADEHASIAAFAMVSLQLQALGAPIELLADTHRAALDEIEHTKLALKMMGEPGTAIGPLDVPPFERVSFAELARSTFLDACCGETLASVRARAAAANVTHNESERHALLTIADDEERHAELGWRTLAWLLSAGGTTARDAVRDALGRIANSSLMTEVIRPCAEAALSSLSSLSSSGPAS